jgi:WhiB family transcriptional regulator, redox-sensing transcriptional regulator
MATKAGIAEWWELAACQSADPELFFPVVAVGGGAVRVSRAKAICARCAIRRQCLDYALVSAEPHGIWGGTTEDERRAIAAHRRLPQQVARYPERP